MINRILRYAVIFVLLIFLQLFLFNNIQFSGYVNPYVYVMFILLLPAEIPSWLLLLLSFFTGLTVDLFTGTPGMHTAATVLAGFTRPYVLRIISPREGYETSSDPSMFVYGFKWFLIYTLVIVLIHHTLLFYLEVFRLTDFLNTFLRVLLSSLFSVTFILLLEYMRRGK
ncbi:MAG: rod shape-determining protein MreD [Bacteroidetes bacterium]|nr:rod shape-determining protein MreD [Bacteroidota bacterium]